MNSYYIKQEKREEFKRLHLSRFRYEYDAAQSCYFRKFRNTKKRRNVIYIDAIDWRIYWDNFGEKRDVVPVDIIKLINHGMVEIKQREGKK